MTVMTGSQEGQPTSLCYISKMPQVKTLHAKLCSDLAYVYSSQSSYILVEQTAPFHDKLSYATMKNSL